MLEELKRIDYHGGKEGLIFFICDVVGKKAIKVTDAKVICAHAAGKLQIIGDELIKYCSLFGWIYVENEMISVTSELFPIIEDKEKVNNQLVISTIEKLFDSEILNPLMFSYDSVQGCYAFKNELLPLPFSCVRNVLVSQGFFVSQRESFGTHFFVTPMYNKTVALYCKAEQKKLTLKALKKRLEDEELAGEKAELFVIDFERKRVGMPLSEKIIRISEIDVTAGYDIVSFESNNSQKPDRFIEVKAVSHNGFYWSKNEYEKAKLKGEEYFLYLVDLSKVNNPEYGPEIICNPVVSIMENDEWYIEAQSYHINHV